MDKKHEKNKTEKRSHDDVVVVENKVERQVKDKKSKKIKKDKK